MKKILSIKDVDQLSIKKIREYYKKFFNSGIEKLNGSFGFGEELVKYAEGINIYTNKRIVKDFTGGSGVLNIGHNHPKILKSRIAFQKKKKMEVHKTFFSNYLAGLAYNISSILPGDLCNSFFCNSGAEAVDGALKLAYKYFNGKRKYVLYSDISFHGKLIGAGSVTSANNSTSEEKSFNFQKFPNTIKFKYNDIKNVQKIIKRYKKNNSESDIYAIIIEPFSASRMIAIDENFLIELNLLCKKNKILLIFDEIYTGWFKTGTLFYFMRYNVIPDILTTAKTLGGGKASISAYISKKEVFDKAYGNLADSLLHSTTYSGFAEECATAIETINILFDEKFDEKVKIIEKKISEQNRLLKNNFPESIETIKGYGAHYGIKFKINSPKLKKILSVIPSKFFSDKLFLDKLVVTAIIDLLYRKFNILTIFTANKEVFLWVSPALVVKEKEIDFFYKSLESCIKIGLRKIVYKFVKRKILSLF